MIVYFQTSGGFAALNLPPETTASDAGKIAVKDVPKGAAFVICTAPAANPAALLVSPDGYGNGPVLSMPNITVLGVDAERDRRIAAGFTFGGNLYQARDQDLRNINGAATGAALALIQGTTTPGDLRWQGGDTDFGWIAADNTIVPMDVVTMVAFGRAAMAHVERLTMIGRSLKDRLAAGEALDITNDALWGA